MPGRLGKLALPTGLAHSVACGRTCQRMVRASRAIPVAVAFPLPHGQQRQGTSTPVSVMALLALVALAWLPGCGRKPPDSTPEGVVREYLERIERVQGDPKDARAAFDLLS